MVHIRLPQDLGLGFSHGCVESVAYYRMSNIPHTVALHLPEVLPSLLAHLSFITFPINLSPTF